MFYRPAVPLPAEVLRKRNVEFTKAAWRAGVRPDQREAGQLRELSVEFPLMTRGLATVRLGGTVATASVSCELVEPAPFKAKHGFFAVHVRQLLNDRDSVSRPRELKTLGLFLERLLKDGVVETEGLCVLPGRRVWSVAVEVLLMNDDGNAADAAQWAAIAALRHFRRPELTIRGETVIVHPPHERDPVPLSLHHTPVCCSFAISLDPRAADVERRAAALRSAGAGSTSSGAAASDATVGAPPPPPAESSVRAVVDPSTSERGAALCTLCVAVNAEGQVCAVEKGEGCDVRWALVQECVATARQLAPGILQTIEDAMTAHDERRRAALRQQFLWAQSRSGVGTAEGKASADADAVPPNAAPSPEDVRATKRARAEPTDSAV